MPIEIQPMTTEDDHHHFVRLSLTAFKTGIGALVLHPRPHDPSADFTMNLQRVHDSLQTDPAVEDARYIKATDTDTGAVVAASKWLFYPNGNSEENLDKILAVPASGSDGYEDRFGPIYEWLMQTRREIMGTRPYVYMAILMTDPAHHRRGAAAKMVQWAAGEADRLGIPSYSEASPQGRLVYERWGYRTVRRKTFEMGEFGREGMEDDVSCIMIREPRAGA